MAKTNLNSENDVALRRGSSAVYQAEKNRKSMKDQLADKETKQKTLDFIFGISEENPIKR